MNYANHNLRTNLQEWKNRLYKSNHRLFGSQLKYFFGKLEEERQLKVLLEDAVKNHPKSEEEINGFINEGRGIDSYSLFESEEAQASFCFQVLRYLIPVAELNNNQVYNFFIFGRGDFDKKKDNIIDDYISSIVNYLHDRLDSSNSIVYLLEKYKKRTEWFTGRSLLELYQNATKSYEQIFEDDLRLFLFDQGIEYPFSTPSSPSGRADIVGQIDTEEPLIVEVKLFDRNKNYGRSRIEEGFTQIVKYTNNYNKNEGYLVIFNLDEVEINLTDSENGNIFPPSKTFNNKTFYFIVVNCYEAETASKSGRLKEIEISLSSLGQS